MKPLVNQDAKLGLGIAQGLLDVRCFRMNRARHKARGSVAKNVILVAIAACLFVITGVIVHGNSKSNESESSEELANTPVKMLCAECRAEWTIPFSKWEELSKEAGKKSERVACKECGKAAAWHNNQLELKIKPADTDNVWVNETGLPPKTDEQKEEVTAEPSPPENNGSADE